MRLRILVGVCLLAALIGGAPARGADLPQADIGLMAWLAGHWRAPAFGGVGEELWLPPVDGAMVGSFRHVGADGIGFYELMVIREVEDSLLLSLKHFHSDLRGWEARDETVDFPLSAVDDDGIHFGRMSFRPAGRDAFTVRMRPDGDDDEELRFDYERVDPAP